LGFEIWITIRNPVHHFDHRIPPGPACCPGFSVSDRGTRSYPFLWYRFQNKDIGCVIGRGWPREGLSPSCCIPKIIILKAILPIIPAWQFKNSA